MRHSRLLTVVLLAFLVLAGNGIYALPTQADTEAEIQAQIDASTKEIQRLKAEIAELEKSLSDTSKQRQTLQKAVDELALNIQKLTKSITLTQTEVSQKDKEINKLAGSIDETLAQIVRSQNQVANSLRELDSLSTQPLILKMLGGGTLSTLFDEATTLEALRLELQENIYTLSNLKVDLEVDKDAAQDKKKELTNLTNRLGQEKQGLDIVKKEQTKLLNDTKNQEAAYQSQITQKRAEQAAFEAALFNLASRLQSTDPTRIPGARSGVLQWPLDDVFVTQQFGKTVDSTRLYASGSHDGVDFRATTGTPVKAALSGMVVEVNLGAVQYCQYGKWVLIRHDNGLSTLYAHLSSVNVKEGDAVATGKVIGYSGNTGYATGPHLHFTVYASDAVSLKQYTCKSGYTVTIPIAPLNAYLNPLSYLPGL
ncbi:MAG: peptidoglycan DD-metalloendopeptidase family protein [Candidatus Adlerbacteria bacterium]|nr:peptidoglycan DD-metalloendopeptidase family protein [Candidatus Adlerbacteria bacterium]